MASRQVEGGERGGSPETTHGGLFGGMSFWLSQNVPQRSRFKELIQQNGGIVKLLEKDADVQIVDHKRKNLPPNVYSYQFIETSIQKGVLEDLETYKAGPSAPRPVGATHIPARGHRLAYTIEDDQILWDWMQPYEQDSNARIRGNKIYQGLEAKHPRHTYQSYRDRYLKRLRGLPRPGGMLELTATGAVSEETCRRSPAPRTSTSRPDEARTQRNETLQRPQERKRKRSPEPTTTKEHASNNAIDTPRRAAVTTQTPPKLSMPPEPPIQRREPSYREVPSSAKRAKTSANPTTQTAVQREPVDEASISINNLFLELPMFAPSPEPEREETEYDGPQQDIDTWIDEHLRAGKGTEAQIIEALRCTSMDPELADKVLEPLVKGKGIPTDMRGVWTAQDDRCVEARDSRDIQQVLEKHGSDRFNARWEYLAMAREAGLENPATT